MFRGINALTIDIKGRLAIPMRYREALGTVMVITIDTKENCLLMYPATEWQRIENELQKLPSFNPVARRTQRLLIGHATDVELDSNARVLLPAVLRDYAKLEKNAVMIGQGNKFELWDEVLWQTRCDQWLAEEAADAEGLSDEMKTFSL